MTKPMDDLIRCKTHPDAPHGFVRNASHTEDRYVCECEFWEPPMDDLVQEPVAWADMDVRGEDKGLSWTPGHFHKTPLYTAQQPRQEQQSCKGWQGLTDREAQWLYDNCRTPANLIDMVEATLREKNT